VSVKGWILAQLILKAVHERMVKCNVNRKMYTWCIWMKVVGHAVQRVGAPSTVHLRTKRLTRQPDTIMIFSSLVVLVGKQ